jgi:hypothetical protein
VEISVGFYTWNRPLQRYVPRPLLERFLELAALVQPCRRAALPACSLTGVQPYRRAGEALQIWGTYHR